MEYLFLAYSIFRIFVSKYFGLPLFASEKIIRDACIMMNLARASKKRRQGDHARIRVLSVHDFQNRLRENNKKIADDIFLRNNKIITLES